MLHLFEISHFSRTPPIYLGCTLENRMRNTIYDLLDWSGSPTMVTHLVTASKRISSYCVMLVSWLKSVVSYCISALTSSDSQLVDEDMLTPIDSVLVLHQQLYAKQKEIVEVQTIRFSKGLLVILVDFGHNVLDVVSRLG